MRDVVIAGACRTAIGTFGGGLKGFSAVQLGTLVGVLPGVGPLAGISLLLPATFGLNATSAIVLLAGIYYGAMYGGSTTSIA